MKISLSIHWSTVLLSKISSPSKFLQIAATSGAALVFASCQSFEKKPLNLAAHDQKWRAQSAFSEEVRSFAKRIAKTSPQNFTFNPTNGISLSEGKLVALVYNPDLRIARMKAGVAKAAADYAGLWNDPQLGLNLFKATESIPNPWIVTGSLAISLPLSGRLSAEKQLAIGSFKVSLLVLVNLPLALIGGIAAIYLTESPNLIDNTLALFGFGGRYIAPVISIASMVGFITLFGIAVRNGILLVNHYDHLMKHEGKTMFDAIIQGSSERLVPILMTALTAALAVVPIVLQGDKPGNEILAPLSVVILGGLLSSTFLNLIIVPAGYAAIHRISADSPNPTTKTKNKS